MKRVLVTGAAGSIGLFTIKYLLSEGKYEITALDLKNSGTYKNLKKYRRRVNIVYGDVTDPILMDALIKDHDYIIHLAGVMPPLADMKKDLSKIIDYKGTENIIRSITFFNPECYLIYPSSTTIYGTNNREITVKTKDNINDTDYYTKTKFDTEKLIKNRLENYTIFRLPIILANPKNEKFIYNGINSERIEVTTNRDVAYALVKSIDYDKKLKGKTYNVGGGETCITTYKELLINILEIYGLSFNYILSKLFLDKNYHCHVYKDSESLENILHYRNDSLASYYMRLKRSSKNRRFNKLLAKPFIWFLKRQEKGE